MMLNPSHAFWRHYIILAEDVTQLSSLINSMKSILGNHPPLAERMEAVSSASAPIIDD